MLGVWQRSQVMPVWTGPCGVFAAAGAAAALGAGACQFQAGAAAVVAAAAVGAWN